MLSVRVNYRALAARLFVLGAYRLRPVAVLTFEPAADRLVLPEDHLHLFILILLESLVLLELY